MPSSYVPPSAPTSAMKNAAMTTAMYLYRTAFDFGEMGTAAALSWLLLLVIAALTWVNNLVFARGGLRDSE